MASEYSVESAVSRLGHPSEKMQQLDVAMQYNFMLYFVHYVQHLDQIETLTNIGDLNAMSMMEMFKFSPGIDMLSQMEQEIGNLSPECYVEDGVFTRINTQWSWGTKYIPPFQHSQDALNCISSTLGRGGK